MTITQSTETGRVYTLKELAALADVCRTHGLSLHMDGARFANACASLGCSPAEMTWKSGVDVLCFGGAKNGMAMGEAVLFFDRGLATDFDYRCKQAGQLASKMRFLSAPWVGMLESGAWLRNAEHANRCAQQFAAQIAAIPGVRVAQPVEANAVFIEAPEEILNQLHARGWSFYTFIGGAARFMFAWDSDPARVDALSARSTGVRGRGASLREKNRSPFRQITESLARFIERIRAYCCGGSHWPEFAGAEDGFDHGHVADGILKWNGHLSVFENRLGECIALHRVLIGGGKDLRW